MAWLGVGLLVLGAVFPLVTARYFVTHPKLRHFSLGIYVAVLGLGLFRLDAALWIGLWGTIFLGSQIPRGEFLK